MFSSPLLEEICSRQKILKKTPCYIQSISSRRTRSTKMNFLTSYIMYISSVSTSTTAILDIYTHWIILKLIPQKFLSYSWISFQKGPRKKHHEFVTKRDTEDPRHRSSGSLRWIVLLTDPVLKRTTALSLIHVKVKNATLGCQEYQTRRWIFHEAP